MEQTPSYEVNNVPQFQLWQSVLIDLEEVPWAQSTV